MAMEPSYVIVILSPNYFIHSLSFSFHPSETVECWVITLWSALAHILAMNDALWIC